MRVCCIDRPCPTLCQGSVTAPSAATTRPQRGVQVPTRDHVATCQPKRGRGEKSHAARETGFSMHAMLGNNYTSISCGGETLAPSVTPPPPAEAADMRQVLRRPETCGLCWTFKAMPTYARPRRWFRQHCPVGSIPTHMKHPRRGASPMLRATRAEKTRPKPGREKTRRQEGGGHWPCRRHSPGHQDKVTSSSFPAGCLSCRAAYAKVTKRVAAECEQLYTVHSCAKRHSTKR